MVGLCIVLVVLNVFLTISMQKTDRELDKLAEETQIFLNDIDRRLKTLEKEIKKK